MRISRRKVLLATAILTVMSIMRVNGAFGDLDTTFGGGDGQVVFHSSGANPIAMVRQKDGKFIAVGRSWYGSGNDFQIVVRRFNVDGTVDTTFGSGGTAVAFNTFGIPKCVALQSDGKILVGGKGGVDSLNNTSAYVWRFTTTGWYDTTFGTNGRVLAGSSGGGVVHLEAFKTSTAIPVTESILAAYGGTIKKLNSNGTTNTTFGTGGTLTGFGSVFTKQNAFSSQPATITIAYMLNGYTIIRGFTADGDVDPGSGLTISYYGDYLNLSLRGIMRTNQDKIVVWAWYCEPAGMPGCFTYPGIIASHSADGVLENTSGPLGFMSNAVRSNPDGTLIVFTGNYMAQLASNLSLIQQANGVVSSDHFIQPDTKVVSASFGNIERRLQ